MAAPTLESYVDHRVMICTAARKQPVTATLCAVDAHGIWIESPELAGELLGSKRPPSNMKPVVFIPFAQLQYVLGVLDDSVPKIIDSAA
jgi:hypothetical protein